ncbi:nuclease-related domain-containing protein [Streptomyces sp. NPDC058621]
MRALDRVLGRESEWDPWFKGLAGERIAGAELDRLTARGWKVLHSIPLTRGGDIDHLLVGPGGSSRSTPSTCGGSRCGSATTRSRSTTAPRTRTRPGAAPRPGTPAASWNGTAPSRWRWSRSSCSWAYATSPRRRPPRPGSGYTGSTTSPPSAPSPAASRRNRSTSSTRWPATAGPGSAPDPADPPTREFTRGGAARPQNPGGSARQAPAGNAPGRTDGTAP